MIQITRQLAKLLRLVIKRTFGRQIGMIAVRTGNNGLVVDVQGANQSLRYHDRHPQDAESLLLPLQVLDDVQGSKAEPVFLNTRRTGVVGASWQENGVFRDLEYDAPEPFPVAPAFPALPATFVQNGPGLLTALRDAYETTDVESKRYALGCVQLRQDGALAATDGRQMLRQTGFQFGCDQAVLIQPSRFFTCKELPAEPVRIGNLPDDKGVATVVFEIGPWTYWLGTEREGRFPDVDSIIPSTDYCKSTLRLSLADARFMAENLHRLPNGATHRELTLDLNGSVVLRAASISTPRPAEMILSNSIKQGDDIRICTDRQFLARAAAMGYSEIHLPDKASPAVARDNSRTYLWMLLSPKDAIKPTDDCVRIESPLDYGHRTNLPTIPQRTTPVNRIANQPVPVASSQSSTTVMSPQPASEPTVRRRKRASNNGKATTSLEVAISLRDQLRAALASSKELIRTIKTEKRGQKSLKLALASLKQLQAVA
ncbi:hypothetical protein [Anatilimnocola floriformis]|uniref:hypothetical protein n=1 Tax=Anatilimnocola floriformis TaxID=2948575 RepID=UPI0020C2B143|nr:hypothetical protein [Anatilimnocola floriformis]